VCSKPGLEFRFDVADNEYIQAGIVPGTGLNAIDRKKHGLGENLDGKEDDGQEAKEANKEVCI
jgi:hypothetical protein